MNFSDLVNEKGINALYNKGLHDDDLNVITEVLQKSQVLELLHLGANRITLTDGKFTDALTTNRSLRFLHLGWNTIGDEGAKRLADAIKVNRTLQKIYLNDNQIGNDGARHLADAVTINKSLQVMRLYNNDIGDEGASSLASSIKENETLQEIYLNCNPISDVGAQTLADALKYNFAIKTLDLWNSKRLSKNMQEEIETILSDPRREVNVLRAIIARKDEEMAARDEEIAMLTAENAALKNDAESPIRLLERIMAGKDEKIAVLESNAESYRRLMDNVDGVARGADHDGGDDVGCVSTVSAKRRRAGKMPNSNAGGG
eukprot:CAMPEP_0201661616 /NCGR_PEP_ID=MMETSP0494-20130426/3934_1 /ASSEMBLY_ACC=CAM_ASM_000839 /TAXON_ID=420259 /ORGANISM="Thalassiosira gravida, Strain GMp14c1" /LENGTH=316 /DNA_ID=CAMNT_0048139773 /DNA_START=78 /DNA_END=1028 /DNA_ORIENTATION=+